MTAILASAALALGASLAGAAAQGAPLFAFTGPTPQMESPGFVDKTFNAGAGAGALTFQLNGFRELDGNVGDLEDDFFLSLNGVEILAGTFNLGGGGTNEVFFQPTGAVVTPHSGCFGCGGTVDISTPLALVAGANTLRFAYSSPIPQGTGDEAWGFQDVLVTGAAAGGVPEPASWAMMLIGFFGLGAALRSRRPVAAIA